jgi:cytosine/adenosine deaminase-related metal-dependent hydrolase
VLLINGCWFDDEIEILAETDTRSVHSPSANMKMASYRQHTQYETPALPLPWVAIRGNNNCHDMIREMKAASLLHKISSMDAEALPAEVSWRWRPSTAPGDRSR